MIRFIIPILVTRLTIPNIVGLMFDPEIGKMQAVGVTFVQLQVCTGQTFSVSPECLPMSVFPRRKQPAMYVKKYCKVMHFLTIVDMDTVVQMKLKTLFVMSITYLAIDRNL
jgi:hypothetical protein